MRFDATQGYTIGEVYRPAMEITDQAEADAWFEESVIYHMERYGQTREEAEDIQRQNLGYFSGYYDSETMKRVQRLFRCAHPIFGKAEDGIPTPDQAFAKGMMIAVTG